MPGLERPRRRPGGEWLEHRRLDFQKTLAVHEAAHRRNHRGPAAEHLAGPRIPEQVQVALPVAGVPVGKAVPLLGERQEGLRQEGEGVGANGQFPRAGPEHGAGDPHPIPEVQPLRDREVALGKHVAPNMDLERSGSFGKAQEGRLSERPDRDNPPGDPHRPIRVRNGFERGRIQIRVGLRSLFQGVGGGEAVRPGGHSEVFDLGQLPPPVPLVPVHGLLATFRDLAHEPCSSVEPFAFRRGTLISRGQPELLDDTVQDRVDKGGGIFSGVAASHLDRFAQDDSRRRLLTEQLGDRHPQDAALDPTHVLFPIGLGGLVDAAVDLLEALPGSGRQRFREFQMRFARPGETTHSDHGGRVRLRVGVPGRQHLHGEFAPAPALARGPGIHFSLPRGSRRPARDRGRGARRDASGRAAARRPRVPRLRPGFPWLPRNARRPARSSPP